MRYKHIIWDFDGTLFNTYPVMAASFNDALKERSIFESVDKIISLMRVTDEWKLSYYKEKYQLDDAFFERVLRLSIVAEKENAKPFDGIVELCSYICKNGGNNYLFTHRGGSSIYFMEKYGLMNDFTELITSKQNFPRKPSPDAILYLINKYGFLNDEAMMIGDREIDVLSGKNAGIHTCYFTDGYDKSDISDFNIDCFSELSKILDVG